MILKYDSRFAYILNIIPHKDSKKLDDVYIIWFISRHYLIYQIYTKNYIKSGCRRNNLIRLLANDKGTAGDWNGYRYGIAKIEFYIEIMRDINNDIEDL